VGGRGRGRGGWNGGDGAGGRNGSGGAEGRGGAHAAAQRRQRRYPQLRPWPRPGVSSRPWPRPRPGISFRQRRRRRRPRPQQGVEPGRSCVSTAADSPQTLSPRAGQGGGSQPHAPPLREFCVARRRGLLPHVFRGVLGREPQDAAGVRPPLPPGRGATANRHSTDLQFPPPPPGSLLKEQALGRRCIFSSFSSFTSWGVIHCQQALDRH